MGNGVSWAIQGFIAKFKKLLKNGFSKKELRNLVKELTHLNENGVKKIEQSRSKGELARVEMVSLLGVISVMWPVLVKLCDTHKKEEVPILFWKIEYLEISHKSLLPLQKEYHLTHVFHLCALSEDEVKKVRGMGGVRMKEITSVLKAHKLNLGMIPSIFGYFEKAPKRK